MFAKSLPCLPPSFLLPSSLDGIPVPPGASDRSAIANRERTGVADAYKAMGSAGGDIARWSSKCGREAHRLYPFRAQRGVVVAGHLGGRQGPWRDGARADPGWTPGPL